MLVLMLVLILGTILVLGLHPESQTAVLTVKVGHGQTAKERINQLKSTYG